MNVILAVILIIANLPLYWLFFWIIFKDVNDFKNSLKYFFTPDIFSFFVGEYWEDRLAQGKLAVFILLSVGAVVLEYNIFGSM